MALGVVRLSIDLTPWTRLVAPEGSAGSSARGPFGAASGGLTRCALGAGGGAFGAFRAGWCGSVLVTEAEIDRAGERLTEAASTVCAVEFDARAREDGCAEDAEPEVVIVKGIVKAGTEGGACVGGDEPRDP